MFYNKLLFILFHINVFKETSTTTFWLLKQKLKSIFIYL